MTNWSGGENVTLEGFRAGDRVRVEDHEGYIADFEGTFLEETQEGEFKIECEDDGVVLRFSPEIAPFEITLVK